MESATAVIEADGTEDASRAAAALTASSARIGIPLQPPAGPLPDPPRFDSAACRSFSSSLLMASSSFAGTSGIEPDWRNRRAVQDRFENECGRVTAESETARRHFVKDRAQ